MVIYHQIAPSTQLAPYVKFFWTLEGQGSPVEFTPHRLFADALPTLVFHYHNHFVQQTPQGFIDLPKSSLSGHNSQVIDMMVKGSFGIFGVYLYPLSIPKLFGLPTRLLAEREYSMEDLLGAAGRTLETRMLEAPDNKCRLACISGFLYKKLTYSQVQISTSLSSCLQHMITTAGRGSIEQIARQSSWSVRSLERKFSQSMGMSPKIFSRILRFQKAIKLFENRQVKTLTELSYQTGYYDQSHFIREFKHFSGMRPRDYFQGLTHTAEGFAQM